MVRCADKAPRQVSKSGREPKPKVMPKGGPSTMERIAEGGKKVKSVAARNKERGKRKFPKGW